jgi:hypothetical protein
LNGSIVGSELPIKLEIIPRNRMVGVVRDRIKIFEPGAERSTGWTGDVHRIANITVIDWVVQAGTLDPTEDVVERAVLKQNPHDVLDFVLEIRDGRGGASFIPEGRWSGFLPLSRAPEQGNIIEDGGGSGQKAKQGGIGLHGGKRLVRKAWIASQVPFLWLHSTSSIGRTCVSHMELRRPDNGRERRPMKRRWPEKESVLKMGRHRQVDGFGRKFGTVNGASYTTCEAALLQLGRWFELLDFWRCVVDLLKCGSSLQVYHQLSRIKSIVRKRNGPW